MVRTRSATVSETTVHNGGGSGLDILPSIRFSTFYDPRAARPSLTFTPISRTLPTGSEIIRVGRYSERDSQPNVPPNVPSAAPVGFKSKVVSRRHCEFWYEGGKWYIKDVKSSSGTFLNHIRLSPPGTESKPFPINDGDIVQLGIDFKGGEEMIFRCVKMRLELNRGWQNKLNTFNMTTHKRLRNMTASSGNASATQSYTQDCSICLNSIAPCQCLFVAPCSHTWHYKCIRSLLSSPSYPIFICPNCRAAADLEADVE
ncbi:SMAD/FHA domain-containing protein, partial [Coniochaeta ligniaria NRRL 30616]